jgi:hypothetical protein
MSNGFKIFLMVFPWLIVAFVAWIPYSPSRIQEHDHELMEAAFPAIVAAITRDQRFADVHLSPSPYDGGVVMSGTVASQRDLKDLQDLMILLSPPVTRWGGQVHLRPTSNP